MRILPLICLFMIFISAAFGQLDANSITVNASRNITPGPPDQALFSVLVGSSLDAGLDDVIAALQGSCITVASFSGLGTSVFDYGGTESAGLGWSFRFGVPFAKTKDTVAMLTALQQSIAKKNNGLTMTFAIQGTQVSTQSLQTCSLPDLIADARVRAQKLADAGGVALGNVLALASTSPGVGLFQVASLGALTAPAPAPLYCSLTVKFALMRF